MAAIRHLGLTLGLIGTTHEEYLVVLIVLQNLVGIAMFNICEFQCYASFA